MYWWCFFFLHKIKNKQNKCTIRYQDTPKRLNYSVDRVLESLRYLFRFMWLLWGGLGAIKKKKCLVVTIDLGRCTFACPSSISPLIFQHIVTLSRHVCIFIFECHCLFTIISHWIFSLSVSPSIIGWFYNDQVYPAVEHVYLFVSNSIEMIYCCV